MKSSFNNFLRTNKSFYTSISMRARELRVLKDAGNIQTRITNAWLGWQHSWNDVAIKIQITDFVNNIFAGPAEDVVKSVIELMGADTTLIFDDAQSFFTTSGPLEEVEKARKVLHLLGDQIKMRDGEHFSVMLISSDLTYPDTIKALGYSEKHSTKYVYAGELNPSESLLLLNSWGVGSQVAELLIGAIGGHVKDLAEAVDKLCLHFLGGRTLHVITLFKDEEIKEVHAAVRTAFSTPIAASAVVNHFLFCLIRAGHAPYNPEDVFTTNFVARLSAGKLITIIAPNAIVLDHGDVQLTPDPMADLVGMRDSESPRGSVLTVGWGETIDDRNSDVITPSTQTFNELSCSRKSAEHNRVFATKASYRMLLALHYQSALVKAIREVKREIRSLEQKIHFVQYMGVKMTGKMYEYVLGAHAKG